jgi:hypothetical protein
MSRFNQILIVLLVVQLALVGFIFWPRPASEAQGGPLLADFNPEEVTALTITDAEGNQLALAKSGDQWVLPDAGGFPVDGEKVTPFLEKIAAVQADRLVTQTEGSHARLQVAPDEFNRRLELTLAKGATDELYVGSSAGAAATHVRADGQPQVFLTGELAAWDANPQVTAWVDTLYFTVPQTATTGITLKNQNGTFEFEKEGDTWTMAGLAEGETLDQAAVSALLNQAGSVRLTDVLGTEEEADFGLAEPLATVTVKTEDDTYTLRVGARDDATNSYVFNASSSPYYVRVAGWAGDAFVNKTWPDFLAEPPAAAGEFEETGSTE